MSFYDDEPILSNQEDSKVPKPRAFIADKTKLTVIQKNNAPLSATNFTVLLELTGNGSKEDKLGVDIVTVLDVSGSMGADNKLEKMKSAMKFLIKKLSPIHRLSVVTFSSSAERKCPLRRMSYETQDEMELLVDGLMAGGGTNIVGALRLALKVLEQRELFRGRVAAILLMSDGDQLTKYEDARKVPVDNVPVFTFGFGKGKEYNPEVLNAIARNSNGGTFSVADVEDTDSNNLSIAFAQCLAGLLTVAVQDLELTITKLKPPIVIKDVSAGNYPFTKNDATTKTISFGHLYNREVRKILVDLALPAVTNEAGYDVLDVSYSYVYADEPKFEAPPINVGVNRTGGAVDEEKEEVTNEQKRVETAGRMEKATGLADKNKFGDAQNELKQAQNSLESVKLNNFIDLLKSEVAQLLEFMQNPNIYNSKGRHFALATLTSHARQRHAARGDDPAKPSLFATPAMNALVKQAIKFDKDPTEPVSQEIVEELTPMEEQNVPNPLAPIVEPLSQNIGKSIQALKVIQESLQAIQDLINSTK